MQNIRLIMPGLSLLCFLLLGGCGVEESDGDSVTTWVNPNPPDYSVYLTACTYRDNRDYTYWCGGRGSAQDCQQTCDSTSYFVHCAFDDNNTCQDKGFY